MQHLGLDCVLIPRFTVDSRIAILVITGYRMADRGQMRPYLVGTSGNQFYFQKRMAAVAAERPVLCADGKRVFILPAKFIRLE